jgi:hypothetical protein
MATPKPDGENPAIELANAAVKPVRARSRRSFRWPEAAKNLIAYYREQAMETAGARGIDHNGMVDRLEKMSGNPRDACLRLLRRVGLAPKRSYREWTRPEQQRLADLIDSVPVQEAARILRRPPGSVRSMLCRLGLGARQGREWFTPSLLAQALHVSRDEVRKWITRGWLECRVFEAHSIKIQIIDAEDFCRFVKTHGREVVGNRLSYEGLAFVRDYVFPRPHADLLSVRGPYNTESGQRTEKKKPVAHEEDTLEEDQEQSA